MCFLLGVCCKREFLTYETRQQRLCLSRLTQIRAFQVNAAQCSRLTPPLASIQRQSSSGCMRNSSLLVSTLNLIREQSLICSRTVRNEARISSCSVGVPPLRSHCEKSELKPSRSKRLRQDTNVYYFLF